MLVFWWTGKGYLTPVILLGTLTAAGVVLQATSPTLADHKAPWGVALILAGVIDWVVGRRRNARKLRRVRSDKLRHRLF